MQALRKRRQSWRTFDFTFQRTIVIPDEQQYTYSGTHFAWFNPQDNLQVLQIPSCVRGVPEKLFTVPVNFNLAQILDVAIEPCSDLLVFVVA